MISLHQNCCCWREDCCCCWRCTSFHLLVKMWKILLILFIFTEDTLLFTSFNVQIINTNPYFRKRDQDGMDKYGFESTHELRPVGHFERSRSKFNKTRVSYYNRSTSCYQLEKKVHVDKLLFISGDIEMNPGPVREPCNNCRKTVAKNHLTCGSCDKQYHIKCSGITPRHYKEIKQTAHATWTCPAFSQYGKPTEHNRNRPID